jgi:hypothetical protein
VDVANDPASMRISANDLGTRQHQIVALRTSAEMHPSTPDRARAGKPLRSDDQVGDRHALPLNDDLDDLWRSRAAAEFPHLFHFSLRSMHDRRGGLSEQNA